MKKKMRQASNSKLRRTCLAVFSSVSLAGAEPCEEYSHLFDKAASRFLAHIPTLDAGWLAAQALAESSCRPDARSPVGAEGLTQIMPATYREIAEAVPQLKRGTPLDPEMATLGQAYYMGRQYVFCARKLQEASPVEVRRFATASYNAGAGNICQRLWRLTGANEWDEAAPHLHKVTGHHSKETIGYVDRIERVYSQHLSRKEQLREALAVPTVKTNYPVPVEPQPVEPVVQQVEPEPIPPTFEDLAGKALLLNLGHTVLTLVIGLSGLWFAFYFVDKRMLTDVNLQQELARGNLATAKMISTVFYLVGAFFMLALYLGFGQ